MRLFPRKPSDIWYVELKHGKPISLKTKNEQLARRVAAELEKKSLEERLHILSKGELRLFSAFVAEYREYRKDKEPNTQRADALALQKFQDFHGDKPMATITAKVLDKFRTHLRTLVSEKTKKPVLVNSVNCWIRHLKIALATAIRWGYIPPFSRGTDERDRNTPTLSPLKVYKVDLRKKIPATKAQILHLIEVARKYDIEQERPNTMETAMAIQYYTGFGRAEVFASISISQGKLTYHRKKTRKLRITDAAEALAPYIAHLPDGIHKVLPWDSVDTYSKEFAVVAHRAGLPDLTTHKLRHAFACHLLDEGARLEDVSELMDHSTVDITKRFYGHISDARLNTTINLLNLKKGSAK